MLKQKQKINDMNKSLFILSIACTLTPCAMGMDIIDALRNSTSKLFTTPEKKPTFTDREWAAIERSSMVSRALNKKTDSFNEETCKEWYGETGYKDALDAYNLKNELKDQKIEAGRLETLWKAQEKK